MFLNTSTIDYNKDIIPFIKNGIIIDASVIILIIDGLVSTRIHKKKLEELFEYKKLLNFLDIIKVNNRWDKFLMTPHIFTEICTYFRNEYNKYDNYKDVVGEIFPFIKDIRERSVCKNDIINRIDFKNPIIEVGDLSIFVIADKIIETKQKIAILAKDRELNREYKYSPNIMVIDYDSIMLNRL